MPRNRRLVNGNNAHEMRSFSKNTTLNKRREGGGNKGKTTN